ncbi:MAG: beta-ketoacyl-[acyl-carrier-protein] synthase II [Gammaproteobacteria bacterium CG_4_10_14_0_8_um_filter_38_16]|nr:MAG: beta-ketoacyl-[acyl-carrier-protein] synthase II [Gammaproteobacteria bacterium CG_4_10_14_0_8_um_filter_38_16]PJA03618.1 MAG: beta-ketoacyl-[acyl-carrier-protein] synthase II [Gammaproteobacteria bacterium CG_4_10_14_0_2_um_filter_38_22]PJB10436.1 MAG: beta-ketoacyl-[acyl-carrier-protein] synthase II [Gammaproteobacteria bacterium CG_4_9_14_3_um_filter_38_9]
MTKRRVVVTGLGMLSPLGNTVEATWDAILAGKSGVAPITRFDASVMTTQIAAEVKDFDPLLAVDAKEARRFDTFVLFAAEAARQAMLDSGLTITDALALRTGCAIGAGIGGLGQIERNRDAFVEGGPRKISPFFIIGAIVNMAPGIVSMKYNLQGPNISIVTACTTGSHNIGEAARMIAYGDADVMLAGGSEMVTTELGIGGFNVIKALSTRNDEPTKASRPWDRDRDGFVLGEGAGVLVLEELEHAKKRGAKIYAELAGFGMSADAYHTTAPEPSARGTSQAIINALHDAKMNANEVQYVNAHGTSTMADTLELLAVKKAFGDHAYHCMVSSTKSMTGHLLGAAGAVEAIFSILAIRDQVAPPTINLDNPDEGCDIDLVPHEAKKAVIHAALSNSFGFGGTNGSLIFKRFE